MKKSGRDDLVILLVALLLLGAMLFTFLRGGSRSRHGVGKVPGCDSADRVAVHKKKALDPGQGFHLRHTA